MWRDQSGLRDGDPPNLEAEQNSFPFPPPSFFQGQTDTLVHAYRVTLVVAYLD